MLKEDNLRKYSLLKEWLIKIRKKKEAAFERKGIKVAEQSTSAGKNTMVDNITTNFQELDIKEQDNMLSWQEIYTT
ncbi:uncharacterized protein OCT59_012616 [Rhizophagus irregularis]|uniref:Uncharacterized protein n=1 Tax=Rhizophagus irregularis (strain DAOM 197198w) TaxID=1432141 RepID=A0A015KYB2_RHIIW|nr:hypothetical protein RirG_068170 [Rhizophagus irregularis DAOM 197198w]UZO01518.1 hypothetical protein OCT59_012616 [Rhizophagus irregularis]